MISSEVSLKEAAHNPDEFELILKGHTTENCNGRYSYDGKENGRPKFAK